MDSNQQIINSSIIPFLKGIGIAFMVTLIALVIFSLVLTYTNVSEAVIDPIIIVITGISILMGSSIGNSKIKKNGLLNGALIGACYFMIIYLISSLLNWKFMLDVQSIVMIAIGIFFGILGGIIGVNRK